ncbi:MAG: chorismate synthase, partial [Saprospiraceae bacterium]|nr:chorismate synthase [Saprospiraceae bacterium]
MPGNSFGHLLRVTTFGESHGKAIGCILDGVPAGIPIDEAFIQAQMDRRRPGQSKLVTQRKEPDKAEILSGVFEGKSTGTPIAMIIYNEDAKPRDYGHIAEKYRPSHADFTYDVKYGNRDYRGGGRSSARETAARVAAAALITPWLQTQGIRIQAYVSAVGDIALEKGFQDLDLQKTELSPTRCPDPPTAERMEALILETRKAGDTIGGQVTGLIQGLPVGLGEPVFDKFHAVLGGAMLGINACKGFEYGSGFSGTRLRGSKHNDAFYKEGDRIVTKSNHSGGVQGGITNGMDVYFSLAFKPVATIVRSQESVDKAGEETTVEGKGRHDPC